MLFNSYTFVLVFLPAALVGFYSFARIGRFWAAVWLISVSFVFYGWWRPDDCLLLAISIVFNYGAATAVGRATAHPGLQRLILVAAIAANLLALAYYKYLGWITVLLNVHLGLHIPGPGITLPLGISFFTFTQIGFLVDCTAGVASERGFLNYLLFVTFFPHLIAGPILHNGSIMPQFAEERTYRFSRSSFAVGSGIFVLGLLKKCLLADPLAANAGPGFNNPAHLALGPAWLALLSYSLELYFDFSGYSDMAIGLARMFNIRFPVNFNSPYQAASVIDYWQRWHITLTRYLTQYLYTPLAVAIMRWRRYHKLPINRAAQVRPIGFLHMLATPLIVTMTLAGIWHGSGTQFLIFGLLHGLYLCINHGWRLYRPRAVSQPQRWARHAGNVLLTYVAVLLATVFFRAPSATAAFQMLASLSGLHGTGTLLALPSGVRHAIGLPAAAILPPHGLIAWQNLPQAAAYDLPGLGLVALYALVFLMPNTQQIFIRYRPTLEPVQPHRWTRLQWRMNPQWAIAFGYAAAVALLSVGGTTEFLYFQF